MCPERNTQRDSNFSYNWHGAKDYFCQILSSQMNIIISNQKLDLTVVVGEVFAICFGPIHDANLVFFFFLFPVYFFNP